MSSSCSWTVGHCSRCSLHIASSGGASSPTCSITLQPQNCAPCTTTSGPPHDTVFQQVHSTHVVALLGLLIPWPSQLALLYRCQKPTQGTLYLHLHYACSRSGLETLAKTPQDLEQLAEAVASHKKLVDNKARIVGRFEPLRCAIRLIVDTLLLPGPGMIGGAELR